jgi:phage shock protein PspC (stress-responsive transcriptional regulator)
MTDARRSSRESGYVQCMARSTALVRPRNRRIIAGVCAALARRFDTTPWRVRLLFLISCLLPGPQFLLYVALWIVLPSE